MGSPPTKTSKAPENAAKSAAESAPSGGKKDAEAKTPVHPRPSASRETIEAIVVAFILAFLFKTFECEAFVIPTGSMAPTLYGRHKEVVCPQCGFKFAIGASEEVDSETGLLRPRQRIQTCLCASCRYQFTRDEIYDLPVFTGDRILVNKFPYEIGAPDRWDVGVFKYPEEPKTAYIKRIVGLPGEVLEIRQGDVYQVTDKNVEILRKDDPYKQRVLQIPVYDNNHPEKRLHELGWPERWAAVRKGGGDEAIAGWIDDGDGWAALKSAASGGAEIDERAFRLTIDRSKDDFQWLRYRHFVPTPHIWKEALAKRSPARPKPQLVTDFCGYNGYSEKENIEDVGLYWVGDLTIHCEVDVAQAQPGASLLLELNEGARKYRCRIELDTGKATIFYPDPNDPADDGGEKVLATAETRLAGAGRYSVSFANVDDRLCLWVDGRLAEFGEGAEYAPYGGLKRQPCWDEDLIPVGIAVKGAEATVSNLFLERDVYYRDDQFRPPDGALSEFEGPVDDLWSNLGSPREWFRTYEAGLSAENSSAGDAETSCRYCMSDDEYFVMGDNSPRSKDSRLWGNARGAQHRHAVPGKALVGKGFFVYWPHGVPFMNNGRGYPDGSEKDSVFNTTPIDRFFYHYEKDEQGRFPVIEKAKPLYPLRRVPFYPNVARMHRIR